MTYPFPPILLIEDDQPTRELYQRELSRSYQVFACDDEKEALEFLNQHSFCVIILEPTLQGGLGWSFLVKLRALSQTCNTPIILCSTLDERRRGMELGATSYLIKPILPSFLLEVIERVILNSASQ